MVRNKNSKHALIVFFLLLSLMACVVGPDFKRPGKPDVADYISNKTPEGTWSVPSAPGQPQKIVAGKRINPDWWHEMGSIKLNTLISEALDRNPTLKSMEATWRQALEIYAAKSGLTKYPQVEAGMGGQRQRFNPESLGQPGDTQEFSLFNAGVGVRYTFDFAGGNKRSLEALAARSDYRRYQLEGARLTLAANIATTAITQARISKQIEILESIVKSEEEQLGLTSERVRLGQAAPNEMFPLQIQLEQTRGSIPVLRNQLQQTEHFMSVLAGRAPAEGGIPSFTLEDFTLPSDLPLVVPSELVRLRPDILGAEAMLHVANAEYGVAISKLYPQLNLSANLGSQALTVGALFNSASVVWGLVAQLTQPLFNPGLPAEKRAALAAFEGSAANYQAVVLESFRDVANVLRALENDSERLVALSAAGLASQEFLNSTQRRYALGADSYYDLLLAQQQSLQTQMNLVEARAKRFSNSIAFYQAMGGGIISETTASIKASKCRIPQ